MALKLIAVAAFATLAWQTPVWAQASIQDRLTAMERHVQYLEKRVADQDKVIVEKDRALAELKKREDKWFNKVAITGGVELEAAHGNPFAGATTGDATVATATVGLKARVHDWVGAEISLLYEEDDTPLEVDVAVVTVAPPRGPWAVKGGRFYVPFGTFETRLISDPLTLEIGETRETALQVGVSANGVSGAVYGFNGDNNKGGDDEVAGFGAAVGYAMESGNLVFALNAGYINDIGDSDNLQDVIGATLGSNDVTDHVAAWTASAKVRYGAATLIGEYLSALDDFQAGEVPFGTGGARPSAWTVEGAWGFKLAGKDATVAVAWQGTGEALALGLPERRLLAGLSVAVVEHVRIAIEWAHDDDYDASDGGTGGTADTVTAQVAIQF